MTHIYTAIVILVLCASSVFGQETCPTGKPSTRNCTLLVDCSSDSKCYRKDNKHFCCGDLGAFCPTKMHAFNSLEEQSYLWGPGGKIETTKWYNVELGGETIACPVPISFAYRRYKELNVLPVDFDESKPASSTPKACSMNSDCKKDNDEFCGTATNPSFQDEVDKSGGNGAPIRFCYKFQNFGSINVKPIIKADETELIGCTNNSDCSQTHGSETFCFIKEDVQIVKNNGTISLRKGLCAFEKLETSLFWWYMCIGSIGCAIIFLVASVVCYFAKQGSSSSPTDEESSATTKLSKIAEPPRNERSAKKTSHLPFSPSS